MLKSIFSSVFFSCFFAIQAQKLPNNFKLIPEGITFINKLELSVDSFYIYETEITNKEFRNFIDYLKENNLTDELNQLKVENVQWKNLINSFIHL